MGWMVAAAAAFNLVCTGTTTFGRLLDLKAQKENEVPFRREFRVDLSAGRWCFDQCASTSPIASIADTQIVFVRDEGDRRDTLTFVNRETGDFLDRYRDLELSFVVMTKAKCEPAPFSGFPARKF